MSFGDRIFIHDCDGHRIFLDTNDIHIMCHMLEHREWEPQNREIIKETLKKADFKGCCVDVGANIGLHSVYMAGLLNNEGTVVCFEPNKSVYQILRDNLDINGLLWKSSIYNCAVSDHAGDGVMHVYDERAGMSGLGKNDGLGECKEQNVDIVTLDDTIDLNLRIPLLKIDVEGFEWDVVKGAKNLIESHKDEITIILEWHPDEMRNATESDAPEKLLNFMKGMEFTCYESHYMEPLSKLGDYREALRGGPDLVFTRGGHLEKLTLHNLPKNNEKSNESINEIEALKELITEKNKQIEFGEKAFYDAVDVQNELKSRLEHPSVKDVMRAIRNFLRG